MESGIFVGLRLESNEYILIANGEAITARTIQRRLVSERCANPEEIISVPVWLGRGQEAAVRPIGERHGRNHKLDKASQAAC